MQKAIAVISDIHSNLEALAAVLDDLKSQEITGVVCLGDVVGYAADPGACLVGVRELGCPVLLGNHDEAACLAEPPVEFNQTAKAGALFSSRNLMDSEKEWLRSLPQQLEIGDVAFTHASLETPANWTYILTADDAEAHFLHQHTHISFCGHTHHPAVWFEPSPGSPITLRRGKGTMSLPPDGKVLINAGSVGQPRDGNNRACYAIYRPDFNTVEFRRIPYNVRLTKEKIIRAGLPLVTAHRLSFGK